MTYHIRLLVIEKGNRFFYFINWYTTRDERVLCTLRAKGKAAHIGFTVFLYGRHDGMNEHGLVASLTGAGIFGVPLKTRGVVIWVAMRSILENCKDVKEALRHLKKIPVGDFDSMVLIDRKDNAAIVEYADGVSHVREVDATEQYLYSVNHYRLPEMQRFNKMNVRIISHSRLRERAIKSHLEKEGISVDDITKLQSTHHPEGLCNTYYNDGFGTLWPAIYDATDGILEACFGAPSHNEYHKFRMEDVKGIHQYKVIAPISQNHLPI